MIIARLLRAGNGSDIPKWVNMVVSKLPQISTFIRLVYFSGLRFVEAVNSYNLLIELGRHEMLNDYYRNCILLHYKFPKTFIRSTKRVYISVVPDALVLDIINSKPVIIDVKKLLQHHSLTIRFVDMRENWATEMVRFLSTAEVDFLMGHCSANVFMSNYFTPQIDGLKQRALKGILELQQRLFDPPFIVVGDAAQGVTR